MFTLHYHNPLYLLIWLFLAEFSYNDKVQTSKGYSSFYLNYRQHPWKSTEPRWDVETEVADVFVKKMQKTREEAVAVFKKAASDMKKYYYEGRQDAPEYYIGDRVYLDGSHIATIQPSRKLSDR